MGADIYLYVETKNETGEWDRVSLTNKQSECVCEWRNYTTFGLLAGVRSCELDPITEPKGLPNNCSQEVLSDFSTSDSLHSTSWYTLKELLDYNWYQGDVHRCTVTLDDYIQYRGTNRCLEDIYVDNTYWCEDYLEVTEEHADRLIKEGSSIPFERVYVRTQWKETHKELCGYFYTEVLQELRRISVQEGVGFEDLRIVFWFDN